MQCKLPETMHSFFVRLCHDGSLNLHSWSRAVETWYFGHIHPWSGRYTIFFSKHLVRGLKFLTTVCSRRYVAQKPPSDSSASLPFSDANKNICRFDVTRTQGDTSWRMVYQLCISYYYLNHAIKQNCTLLSATADTSHAMPRSPFLPGGSLKSTKASWKHSVWLIFLSKDVTFYLPTQNQNTTKKMQSSNHTGGFTAAKTTFSKCRVERPFHKKKR